MGRCTLRVRSTKGRQCFQGISLSVHTGEGGYPSPRFSPRSLVLDPLKGVTPVPGSFNGHWSQVLSGGTQVLVREYPSPIHGIPLDRGTLQPRLDWGTPCWDRTGVPPHAPRQNSRASTFYTEAGVPLAVTQEDFLVHHNFTQ